MEAGIEPTTRKHRFWRGAFWRLRSGFRVEERDLAADSVRLDLEGAGRETGRGFRRLRIAVFDAPSVLYAEGKQEG
jgi:hypothetical protein